MVSVATLILGTALLAQAQPPQGGPGQRFGGRGGSFLGLLAQEKVQKELKLNDEQVAKVKEAGEKIRADMAPQWSGVRDIQDQAQRRAKSTELANEADQKAREQLRDVLSREQMMRLFQIRLQVRGLVWGLNNPRLAERLQLTEEQKTKAAEIEKATQAKVAEAMSGMRDLSQEQRQEKMAGVRKIRDEAKEQALGILTDQQKEALQKMQGEKFEL
jgi:hypothetical protein